MALQDDFETIRATILHRSPLSTVESALSELLAEETHKGLLPNPASVFAIVSHPKGNYSKGKSTQGYQDMSKIQCIYCKEYGHMVKNCPSPTSNNMRNKKKGITCFENASDTRLAAAASSEKAPSTPPSTHGQLTTNIVQEMIQQAISQIGNITPTVSALSVPSGSLDGEASWDRQ
ncbi:uncharacterized protein LOC143889730 [Tasmannia lanceolata]|uniref:uncharacterized protein LOC143889730 n=1 Tax=Tasmannia lanceolata TaxID=3420 RepID=UPI0040636937